MKGKKQHPITPASLQWQLLNDYNQLLALMSSADPSHCFGREEGGERVYLLSLVNSRMVRRIMMKPFPGTSYINRNSL